MAEHYYKYKALSLTPDGELDERSLSQVVDPIIESYYFLPTREKLNDPNEGIFQNQIQSGITAFLQGVTAIGERIELTRSLHELARQISQSTDNSGVFSLSRNTIDELMWAHYGSSHCGMVIEYDLELLTRFSSRQHLHRFSVEYSEEPPNLDMQSLQGNAGEAVRKMLGHKSPRWSYEEEFRIVLENTNGRIPHDYRAIKSITFGLKIYNKVREIIYESTKHKVPEYFEITKAPGTYLLERKRLESYQGESPTGSDPVINWEDHFEHLSETEKGRLIEIAQGVVIGDPHFKELTLADRSSSDNSKAVLQYEAQHHFGLEPWVKYTKHYYELRGNSF